MKPMLYIKISNFLEAVIEGSNNRKDPAAAFLGFTKSGSSSASLDLFSSSKLFRGMNTSPLTSKVLTPNFSIGIKSGIDLMVFKFSVISSPSFPFPLVVP